MTNQKISPEVGRILDEIGLEMEQEQQQQQQQQQADFEDASQGPVYNQEMLQRDLAERKRTEEKEARARHDEQAREHIRQVYRQEIGVEPTQQQLEAALAEKRRADHADAAEAARHNEWAASRAIHKMF